MIDFEKLKICPLNYVKIDKRTACQCLKHKFLIGLFGESLGDP